MIKNTMEKKKIKNLMFILLHIYMLLAIKVMEL